MCSMPKPRSSQSMSSAGAAPLLSAPLNSGWLVLGALCNIRDAELLVDTDTLWNVMPSRRTSQQSSHRVAYLCCSWVRVALAVSCNLRAQCGWLASLLNDEKGHLAQAKAPL